MENPKKMSILGAQEDTRPRQTKQKTQHKIMQTLHLDVLVEEHIIS
jgi:hypothetical protein